MSLELRISSQAEADVAGAFDWYQVRGINLGVDFLRCVDATMAVFAKTRKFSARVTMSCASP